MTTKLTFVGKEDIATAWERVAPILQRGIDEAVRGEFTLISLARLIHEGHCLIAYIEENDRVLMAMVLEFKFYPDMKVLNVVVMAGERMTELFVMHQNEIAAFAKKCGAVEFESSGSKAMARMLKSVGWRSVYVVSRFKL